MKIKSNELIEELHFNNKYLNDDYTNSRYYRDYLKKITEQLILNTFN